MIKKCIVLITKSLYVDVQKVLLNLIFIIYHGIKDNSINYKNHIQILDMLRKIENENKTENQVGKETRIGTIKLRKIDLTFKNFSEIIIIYIVIIRIKSCKFTFIYIYSLYQYNKRYWRKKVRKKKLTLSKLLGK